MTTQDLKHMDTLIREARATAFARGVLRAQEEMHAMRKEFDVITNKKIWDALEAIKNPYMEDK